jgi:hypothetical protein
MEQFLIILVFYVKLEVDNVGLRSRPYEGFQAGSGDDVLDGAIGHSPIPLPLGDVILRRWMLADEVVQCRLSLLVKQCQPVLARPRVPWVEPQLSILDVVSYCIVNVLALQHRHPAQDDDEALWYLCFRWQEDVVLGELFGSCQSTQRMSMATAGTESEKATTRQGARKQ